MSEVNLKKYAGGVKKSPYDVLAKHNREYQKLLNFYPHIVKKYIPNAKLIADLGCGTGNFTLKIYEALKNNENLKIYASDISQNMLDIFNQKIKEKNLENVIITEIKDANDINSYEKEKFDLINITHCLNYTGRPREVLKNINYWLKPNGILIVTDIGRELIVQNWSKGVFKWTLEDMKKKYGFFGIIPTLYLFYKYRDAKKENINFEKGQVSGRYPLHTSEEFKKWVEDAGFEILFFDNTFYKDPVTGVGTDDLVVAKKINNIF